MAVNFWSSGRKSWSWGAPAFIWMRFVLVRARRLSAIFPNGTLPLANLGLRALTIGLWFSSLRSVNLFLSSNSTRPGSCEDFRKLSVIIILGIYWPSIINRPTLWLHYAQKMISFNLQQSIDLAAVPRPAWKGSDTAGGERKFPELVFNIKLLFLVPRCILFQCGALPVRVVNFGSTSLFWCVPMISFCLNFIS